jgi:hypothetical protein
MTIQQPPKEQYVCFLDKQDDDTMKNLTSISTHHQASIYNSLCSIPVKSNPPLYLTNKESTAVVTQLTKQNGSNASTVPTCPMWF